MKLVEIFEKFNSSKNGLNSSQVTENVKYGQNILKNNKKESFFVKFLKQFSNLMVLVLLISAVVSTIISLSTHKYDDLFEGALIFVIVVANAIIGVVQEQKAEVALEEIKKLSSPKSKVLRNGQIATINSTEIVVGDVVLLKMGDNVPADIKIFECNNLKVNESSLTGESEAVFKTSCKDTDQSTPISEREDMCFSGTSVAYGSGRGVVVAVGEHTQMGKIAGQLLEKQPKSPLEKNMERIGKVITYGVLVIVAIVFLSQLIFNSEFNFLNSFLTAVALAVAAIPESLPAVITIVMALGVEKLAKHGAIVKSLASVETLGSCTCLATDKTGTLTQNKMKVKSVYFEGELISENFKNKNLDILFKAITLCNNTKLDDKNNYVGDATEVSLLKFAKANSAQTLCNGFVRTKEFAFDSTRKIMSVIVKKDGASTLFSKGALDFLLPLCSHIVANGKEIELSNEDKLSIYRAHEQMAKNAERVLAVAFKNNVQKEEDLTFVGLVGIVDPPREEVKPAIEKCKKAGLKPIMITGDHPTTALAIAKELGIATSEEQVLTGKDIDNVSDKNLHKIIKHCTVFARVSPEHKTRLIKALKKSGNIVGFAGDGINDAPSVKIADIGVAMGSGTDVTKSAADIIISTDDYSTIVLAVEQGRTIFSNIQKVLLFLLSTNMVEVIGIFVAAIIMPSATFLLPSQILFVNLVTDSLPAFALGLEKPENNIMQKPPRNPKSTIFSEIGWPILIQGFAQSFIVMIMFVVCFNMFENDVASTMVFVTICLMQIIDAINCKSLRSLTKIKLFNNKTFNISFVTLLALILLICFVPPLASLFSIVPLSALQWLTVALVSISIIPVVEICKYFTNHKFSLKNKRNFKTPIELAKKL
ncbi:MAG: calcium-translocating P-type ATPase, PMCA-type [Clostridia bacterium]|nr:calcium-translocating P-type ATPase, PMCA-type [Clostridia bacterium]